MIIIILIIIIIVIIVVGVVVVVRRKTTRISGSTGERTTSGYGKSLEQRELEEAGAARLASRLPLRVMKAMDRFMSYRCIYLPLYIYVYMEEAGAARLASRLPLRVIRQIIYYRYICLPLIYIYTHTIHHVHQ